MIQKTLVRHIALIETFDIELAQKLVYLALVWLLYISLVEFKDEQ
ncbi:hypothetical protein [Paraburkholderia sediminicola]